MYTSLGDDASLPKKQMEILSDILQSAFFKSVKDVSFIKLFTICYTTICNYQTSQGIVCDLLDTQCRSVEV